MMQGTYDDGGNVFLSGSSSASSSYSTRPNSYITPSGAASYEQAGGVGQSGTYVRA